MTVISFRQLALVTVVALAGCGSTGPEKSEAPAPAVRQVTQSAHCGLTGPGMAWVETDEKREKLLDLAGQNMVTSMVRKVDLSRERLVFVTLGQKPKAGYSVGLDEFSVDQNSLTMRMRVREPAPDAMVAQVITSPCVVLAVSPVDWQQVKVIGVSEQPLVKSTGQMAEP
ncbi:MAG: protease complex subunit PrcB family protein [Marinobacter sp.]|nr:protease complex subunit PrcB family protein [Marinobacter sp.]